MREKLKTVKNTVVHVLILLLVFIGAVVLFEKLINQSTPNSAQDMENSTFPLVYMQNKGVSYNCLHGYAYEMDVTNIRDTVTVLGDSMSWIFRSSRSAQMWRAFPMRCSLWTEQNHWKTQRSYSLPRRAITSLRL